ncbi:hypothetical protein A4R43_01940 [Amycolatopsis albispora]|uniref:Uncharacterized protein n=2 Tax=Amycolatopsis albispora TaxID=1804986 RepID=A0A344L063_9PSEU|nr:hypothetical protein A4R43_01940 [Amycolatopsis albispora]
MGTNAEIGPVKLRNVYIERPADGTYQRGEDARLAVSLFTDESIQDSLIAVSSSVAEQVRLQWDQACDGEAETVPAIPCAVAPCPRQAPRK